MATPSILFITADEMRADATGFGGNPDCRTPHLDTLAAGGVCFRRHFAVFPKCVPSRISMLTGRYTHTGGQRTVMGPDHLPKGSPNLVSHLRQNGGYETAVFGLNHVWDNEWFYDFGKADSVVDYHSFATPELDAMAKQARPYPVRNPNGPHPIPELQFIGEVGCVEGEKAGFFDENRTDNALHYLRKLRDPAKPFYLQLNLSLPHPDYKIHEPYYSMYDRESLTPYPLRFAA
ncbi:MAG: sulfatase-like hydrolase/transferase [Opitutales bacterium]